MVEAMEGFPGAVLGLSREIKADKTLACSFTPRDAYAEHFWGQGFEVLEEVEMIEVKQGPYVGEGLHKTRFASNIKDIKLKNDSC